jgi:hypothetical protein
MDSDDEGDAELPLIDPLSNNRTMRELTDGLVEIQRVLSAYTDTFRDRTGSTYHTDAIMWVYRERYQGGTIHGGQGQGEGQTDTTLRCRISNTHTVLHPTPLRNTYAAHSH